MRLPALILAALLCCWSAVAQPAIVQQAQCNVSGVGATCVTTLGSNVTAGNSLVAFVGHLTTRTVSNCQLGNDATIFFTKDTGASVVGTSIAVDLWYLHGNSNATRNTIQCTMSGISAHPTIISLEVSGLTNAAPESNNTNTGVTSSTVTTNSVTPASAANMILAVSAWTANDYSTGPTNGFTRLTQSNNGVDVFVEGAYLVQASATAQSTGYGLTAGINWAAGIAVFGAPTTGPTNAQRSAGFWAIP